MKILFKFSFLQIVLPTLTYIILGVTFMNIYGYFVLGQPFGLEDRVGYFFLSGLFGIIFGILPCFLFAWLTKHAFKSLKFIHRSVLMWLLSYLFTIFIFTISGVMKIDFFSSLKHTIAFAFIAALFWVYHSAKYLKDTETNLFSKLDSLAD